MKLGWAAWALSMEIRKELLSVIRLGLGIAGMIRSKTESINEPCAPVAEVEPFSSWLAQKRKLFFVLSAMSKSCHAGMTTEQVIESG